MGGIGIVGVNTSASEPEGSVGSPVKSAEVVPLAVVGRCVDELRTAEQSEAVVRFPDDVVAGVSSVRVSLMDAVSLTEPCTEGAESVVASSNIG